MCYKKINCTLRNRKTNTGKSPAFPQIKNIDVLSIKCREGVNSGTKIQSGEKLASCIHFDAMDGYLGCTYGH